MTEANYVDSTHSEVLVVVKAIRDAGGWVSNDGRNLILPKQAAALLNKSTRTLDTWRYSNKGPPPIKTGGRYVYKIADVLAYQKARWAA